MSASFIQTVSPYKPRVSFSLEYKRNNVDPEQMLILNRVPTPCFRIPVDYDGETLIMAKLQELHSSRQQL